MHGSGKGSRGSVIFHEQKYGTFYNIASHVEDFISRSFCEKSRLIRPLAVYSVLRHNSTDTYDIKGLYV